MLRSVIWKHVIEAQILIVNTLSIMILVSLSRRSSSFFNHWINFIPRCQIQLLSII
jgi:hypothetical protein